MTGRYERRTEDRQEAIRRIRARSGGVAPEQRAIVHAADELRLSYVEVASLAWADVRWASSIGIERWSRWDAVRPAVDRLRALAVAANPRSREARGTTGRAA